MRKKKEDTYQITPKGLIGLAMCDNKNSCWDELELYCYRYGYNAILIDNNGGQFIHIEKEGK